MSPIPDMARAYLQHRITGEIFAAEFLLVPEQPRELVAVRKCSRPEEQQAGALPVMTLYPMGDDIAFVRKSMAELNAWEPPTTPEEAVKEALDAQANYDRLDVAYKQIRAKERAAAKELEGAGEEVRKRVRALADARAGTTRPPLLAAAEAPPLDIEVPHEAIFDGPVTDDTGDTGPRPIAQDDPDFHDTPDEGDQLPL